MKSKSISKDADRIVNGLLVCKPLADEVYKKLRVLALADEEDFRNNRIAERHRLNNGYSKGGH
mgnify:FL=1|jgi:hypothetical protein|tara:strand:+ start:808 stop:996 length:189 start_codon:yes stop_codon:yes gene_type:complete